MKSIIYRPKITTWPSSRRIHNQNTVTIRRLKYMLKPEQPDDVLLPRCNNLEKWSFELKKDLT